MQQFHFRRHRAEYPGTGVQSLAYEVFGGGAQGLHFRQNRTDTFIFDTTDNGGCQFHDRVGMAGQALKSFCYRPDPRSTTLAIAHNSPLAFSSVATTSALVPAVMVRAGIVPAIMVPAVMVLVSSFLACASSSMGQDRPGHSLQRQNLIDRVPLDRLIRHTENHAGGLILGDGHSP